MATQLSQLLDRKDALERKIISTINRDDQEAKQVWLDELSGVLAEIQTLTVQQAQARVQREFLTG